MTETLDLGGVVMAKHFLTVYACVHTDAQPTHALVECPGYEEEDWSFECTATEGDQCREFCDGCETCAEFGYQPNDEHTTCIQICCHDDDDALCGKPIIDTGHCRYQPWVGEGYDSLDDLLEDNVKPQIGRHAVNVGWNSDADTYSLTYADPGE